MPTLRPFASPSADTSFSRLEQGEQLSISARLQRAWRIAREQFELQRQLFASFGSATCHDARAVSLATAVLVGLCALLSTINAVLSLHPMSAVLCVALLFTSGILALLEAEGDAAAELISPVVVRVPLLQSAAGRALWYGFSGLISMLAGPPALAVLGLVLLVIAALHLAYAHFAAAPLARLKS